MRKLFMKFWRDDCGAVGPEWACIMTVLVLGSVGAILAAKQSLVYPLITLMLDFDLRSSSQPNALRDGMR